MLDNNFKPDETEHLDEHRPLEGGEYVLDVPFEVLHTKTKNPFEAIAIKSLIYVMSTTDDRDVLFNAANSLVTRSGDIKEYQDELRYSEKLKHHISTREHIQEDFQLSPYKALTYLLKTAQTRNELFEIGSILLPYREKIIKEFGPFDDRKADPLEALVHLMRVSNDREEVFLVASALLPYLPQLNQDFTPNEDPTDFHDNPLIALSYLFNTASDPVDLCTMAMELLDIQENIYVDHVIGKNAEHAKEHHKGKPHKHSKEVWESTEDEDWRNTPKDKPKKEEASVDYPHYGGGAHQSNADIDDHKVIPITKSPIAKKVKSAPKKDKVSPKKDKVVPKKETAAKAKNEAKASKKVSASKSSSKTESKDKKKGAPKSPKKK